MGWASGGSGQTFKFCFDRFEKQLKHNFYDNEFSNFYQLQKYRKNRNTFY